MSSVKTRVSAVEFRLRCVRACPGGFGDSACPTIPEGRPSATVANLNLSLVSASLPNDRAFSKIKSLFPIVKLYTHTRHDGSHAAPSRAASEQWVHRPSACVCVRVWSKGQGGCTCVFSRLFSICFIYYFEKLT